MKEHRNTDTTWIDQARRQMEEEVMVQVREVAASAVMAGGARFAATVAVTCA